MKIFRSSQVIDDLAGQGETNPAINSLKKVGKPAGILVSFAVPIYYIQQLTGVPFAEDIMSIAIMVFVVVLVILAVYHLAKQPGSSFKTVAIRVGLFFAICVTLTLVMVLIGYIFHAPGINPLPSNPTSPQ